MFKTKDAGVEELKQLAEGAIVVAPNEMGLAGMGGVSPNSQNIRCNALRPSTVLRTGLLAPYFYGLRELRLSQAGLIARFVYGSGV